MCYWCCLMTWKSTWCITGIRSKIWLFRQYQQLRVFKIQNKTKLPLSYMSWMKTGVREAAIRDYWINYHHHPPNPLHDYITKHGLGFYKPLGGNSSHEKHSSWWTFHVTVLFIHFTCPLSSSQSLELKWMAGTWCIRESRMESSRGRAVEIHRPY